MKLVICDDRIEEGRALKQMLQECLQEEVSETYEIICFTSGESFLYEFGRTMKSCDMVFLDIFMDGIDGIRTAKRARRLFPELELVFITHSRDFAVEAFQLQALHYLVKPITREQIYIVLDRYRQKKGANRYLEVRQRRRTFRLRLDRICYLQSCNNGTDIFVNNEVLHVKRNTSSLAEQLDGRFLSIRRGMYVNMSFINRMGTDHCVLKNRETVLLSRKERADIRNRYWEYILEK